MYIGGTDEKALHHLFAEVIDNAMDEALAGHATFIEVEVAADGTLAVTDNGRGIPVDPHPKFPKKSALEVVMCTLHTGGKFDSNVYETSGGPHGAVQQRLVATPADLDPAEQIGLGARHFEQALRIEFRLVAKNLGVRLEAHPGELFEAALGNAARKHLAVELAAQRHLDLEPLRQRIDHRDAESPCGRGKCL
jgi:hypothetical protein